jgi:hypothetical protein
VDDLFLAQFGFAVHQSGSVHEAHHLDYQVGRDLAEGQSTFCALLCLL